MNDPVNPYRFETEAEEIANRTGDFDLADYEQDDKGNPPWPKTPFVIELYRRKRFRKERYRLTIGRNDFLLESEHLDVPVRCGRSVAGKCLFWSDAVLLVECPGRPKLRLKSVRGERWYVKYALLASWAQQIEKEEDCRKRVDEATRIFAAGNFIGCVSLFLLINYLCIALTWLGFFGMPFWGKAAWTACLLGVTFLTWKSTKKIWPLYVLLAFFFALAVFILQFFIRNFSDPGAFGRIVPVFIFSLMVWSGVCSVIRMRRAVNDPHYLANVGEASDAAPETHDDVRDADIKR